MTASSSTRSGKCRVAKNSTLFDGSEKYLGYSSRTESLNSAMSMSFAPSMELITLAAAISRAAFSAARFFSSSACRAQGQNREPQGRRRDWVAGCEGMGAP